MPTAPRRSLFSLYLTYFADYFSWGVVISFLAIYLNPNQSPFHNFYNLSPELVLGVSFACFPIGEALGSPILTDLSDVVGQKKILIWSLFGSIFSLTLCAASLWKGWLLVFLSAQVLLGFFAGKQTLVQTIITRTDPRTNGQKIALISVLGGVAWISGPYLGGLLLERPFTDYGGCIWPSVLGSSIFGLALACSFFFFEDAHKPKPPLLSSVKFMQKIGSSVNLIRWISDLFLMTFKEKIFILFVMNLIGWYLAIVSTSYFLIQKFHTSYSNLGIFNARQVFYFIAVGLLGSIWILHRLRTKRMLFWMQMIGALGIFSLFGSEKMIELWIYLVIPAITEALIYPIYQAILSDNTMKQNKDKIFGFIHAINGIFQIAAAWMLPSDFTGGAILIFTLIFIGSSIFFIPLAARNKKATLKAL